MENWSLSQLHRKAKLLYSSNIPLLLFSRPGEGKTCFIKAFAADEKLPIRTFSGGYAMPEDIGVPDLNSKSGRLGWTLANWIPLQGDDSPEHGILFFDDIATAPRGVQASLLELLTGSVRGVPVKPWWIVSATNRTDDLSESDPVSFAYANRGAVATYQTTAIDVAHLANMLDWPEPLKGFYNWCAAMKQELCAPNMVQVEAGEYAQPTNRSRGLLAQLIRHGATQDDYAALVGNQESVKIFEYVTIAAEAPTLRSILADPKGVKIVDKLGVQYAVAVGLASHTVKDLAGSVALEPFISRLTKPIQSYYRAVVRDGNPQALNLPAWESWAKAIKLAPAQN